MLTSKVIEDLLFRLGLSDMSLTLKDSDTYGDYICVVDPDTDFKVVRGKILNNHIYNKKINTQGINNIELYDTVWLDGNKVNISFMITYCEGNFGTQVKLNVRSIDVNIKGEIKSFLSIGSYKNYEYKLALV